MTKRRIAIALAAVAVCIAVAVPALLVKPNAKAEKDDDLPVLVVGSDSYPPYVSTDQNGKPAGIDVDILTEALGRIGYRPRFKMID